MLYQQTLEKLRALRLEGMADALEEQRRQSDLTPLEFEERLGLLVERQWIWRENRGLATRLKRARFKLSNACLEDLDYRSSRGLKRAQKLLQKHRAAPTDCCLPPVTKRRRNLARQCRGTPVRV